MNSNAPNLVSRMSLDEARSVIWPFREIKGQTFGSLWDRGLLSSQDMNYAIQRAYDVRVREAARTILSDAASEAQISSENDPGPLNVISTKLRSFAEKRQIQIVMIEGTIFGFILGAAFFYMVYAIWRMIINSNHTSSEQSFATITSRPIGIIIFAIVFILYIGIGVVIVYAGGKALDFLVFNRLDRQMRLYRQGQLGEERVLNVLMSVLDGRWWLFRNMELPGRHIGDLDLVLVGPHGVWNFEVKAYSGEFRNVGDQWEKRGKGKWHTIRKNPTRQAKRTAAELSQLLSTHQIKQWVTPVIVWANPDSTVTLNNPSISVWTLDHLSDCLKGLSSERPIPTAQVEKIVEVLKKIAEEADAEISD